MKQKQDVIWMINQYASTPQIGMGGRSYYLAEEIAATGSSVFLICASYHHLLRDTKQQLGNIEIENRNDNFKVVRVKMPCYKNAHSRKRVLNWFLFAFKTQILINKYIDKPNAILYSSPSLIPFWGAKNLAKKNKCRLIFEVRDIWPLTLIEVGGISPKNPLIWLMQKIEEVAYKKSDKVISNLPYAIDHMKIRGLDEKKFSWIPNGFSLNEVENKESLSEEVILQIPKNKFIIGYTGSLGEANALDSLIESANLLKSEKNIAFLLVGNGKNKEKLQKKVNDLGLTNVIFIDAIPKNQIQSMLARFDVCYIGLTKNLLFRFGVSPNKLFDYLYSSKPVVYAIDSGKYRPIHEYKAGIEVEPENPEEIKNAIIELYNMTEEKRGKLGENGKILAMESYEYSKIASKLSKILLDE